MLKLQYDSKMKEFENFPADIHPANYEMKRKEKPVEVKQPGGIDPATFATLQTLDKEALISLIERVAGAMWGIGLKTKEQRREAILLRLAVLALTSKEAKDVVATARELFDRETGKPIQQVDASVRMTFEPLVIRRIDIAALDVVENQLVTTTQHVD